MFDVQLFPRIGSLMAAPINAEWDQIFKDPFYINAQVHLGGANEPSGNGNVLIFTLDGLCPITSTLK